MGLRAGRAAGEGTGVGTERTFPRLDTRYATNPAASAVARQKTAQRARLGPLMSGAIIAGVSGATAPNG